MRSIWTTGGRLILAVVFLAAAVAKLGDLGGFAAILRVGTPHDRSFIASIIVAFELLTGACLLLKVHTRTALMVSAGLLLMFTLYSAFGRTSTDCGCFGAQASKWLSAVPPLIRNGLLLGVNLGVLLCAREKSDGSRPLSPASLAGAIALTVAVVHSTSPTTAVATIPYDAPRPGLTLSLSGYLRAAKDPALAILDLRTKEEFAAGRIAHSVNVNSDDAVKAIFAMNDRLSTASMVIVYGSPGVANRVPEFMKQLGLVNKSVFFYPTAVDDWRGAPFGWETGSKGI